jgi:hypothetical protein
MRSFVTQISCADFSRRQRNLCTPPLLSSIPAPPASTFLGMSSTFPPLPAHDISLCLLIHSYVRQDIVNEPGTRRRSEKREREAAKATPAKTPAGAAAAASSASHAVFHSPVAIASSSGADLNTSAINRTSNSFFASPTASSGGGGTPTTPAPVTFNLGLNFSGSGGAGASAPETPQPVKFDLGLGGGGDEKESANSADDEQITFTKKQYQRLGTLLQRAIQNGAVYDPKLYTSDSTESKLNDDEVDASAPRFPSLSELRRLLVQNLPDTDGFNSAVEGHLLQCLSELKIADDLLNLMSSLSGFLIVYSHKLSSLQSPTAALRALDESSALGRFVRQVRQSLEGGGMFGALVSAWEGLEKYKRAGGLDADGLMDITEISVHPPPFTFPEDELAHDAQHEQDAVLEDEDWIDPWKFELTPGEQKAERSAAGRPNDVRTKVSASGQPPSASLIAPQMHLLALRLPSLIGRISSSQIDRLVAALVGSSGAAGSAAHHSPPFPIASFLSLQRHILLRRATEAEAEAKRYFDYFGGRISTSQQDGEDAGEDAPRRRALTQQYASLALASLHYTFQHHAQSVSFASEAIKLAQAHKDTRALRLATELLAKIAKARATKGGSSRGSAGSHSSEMSLAWRLQITRANAEWRKKDTAGSAATRDVVHGQSMPLLDAQNAVALSQIHLMQAGPSSANSSTGATATVEVGNDPRAAWRCLTRASALAASIPAESPPDPAHSALTASIHLTKSTAWRLLGSQQLAKLETRLAKERGAVGDEGCSPDENIHILLQELRDSNSSYDAQLDMLAAIQQKFANPEMLSLGSQIAVLHAEFALHCSVGAYSRAAEVSSQVTSLGADRSTDWLVSVRVEWMELSLAMWSPSHSALSLSLPSILLRIVHLAQACVQRGEMILAQEMLEDVTRVMTERVEEAIDQPTALPLVCSLLSPLLLAHRLSLLLRLPSLTASLSLLLGELHLTCLGDVGAAAEQAREARRLAEKRMGERWQSDDDREDAMRTEEKATLSAAPKLSAEMSSFLSRVHLLLARCELARLPSASSHASSDEPEEDAMEELDRPPRHVEGWKAVIELLRQSLSCAPSSDRRRKQQQQIHGLLAQAYDAIGLTEERNVAAQEFCRLESEA